MTDHNSRPHRSVFLHDYRPFPFKLEGIDLRFDLFEEETRVTSKTRFHRTTEHRGEPLQLYGKRLELLAIRLDGQPLAPDRYRLSEHMLTIDRVPASFGLEIETRIFPQKNTALEGLYKSAGMFCTQCEAEGFRAITYYPDRPDVLSPFTTRIIADRKLYPVLLANGNCIETGRLDDDRHYAVWEDPFLKPSYLFALVAGNLGKIEDTFRTISGRDILLQIYTHHHHLDKCDHAMRSLKKAMRWDEEVYGLEYDLNQYMIVAVDDFNMGAMENKGLNVFNSKYVLCRPDTATDQDYEAIEAVIGHEYFHNWTGNRVTCRDWFQLSLKEGLTVFRDQQFSGDMTSPAVKRIDDVRLLRNNQFPEDAGPMAHPVRPDSYIEINNFYTVTVYEKGAEVIRMLHTLLGQQLFREGLRLYLQRHDGKAATVEDFVQAMADVSGRDLSQFKRWYTQAGTPKISVRDDYDPATATYTLTIRQSCPPTPNQQDKQPFHIPIAMGLLTGNGTPLRPQLAGAGNCDEPSCLLELSGEEQSFVFSGVPERPVPSLLRNFSAPVIVDYPYSKGALAFLFEYDADPFNRWEAGQRLMTDCLLQLIEACRQGAELKVPQQMIEVFDQLLTNRQPEDHAFAALLLSLPSEEYLAEQMPVIDVEAVHRARRFLRKTLAEALEARFTELFLKLRPDTPYRYDPEQAGIRQLRNLCLSFLAAGETERSHARCRQQFEEADNMTDCIAALRELCHRRTPSREQALQAFYEKWRQEPLVLDKWLALQATAPLEDTLNRVRDLMQHPSFSINNPNRVRALLGSFSRGNPLCFHEKSGAGYRFLADQVLTLDPLNSQIAARLLTALSRWHRYDGERQALMRAELQRILASKGLSRDCYEVASKSLGE